MLDHGECLSVTTFLSILSLAFRFLLYTVEGLAVLFVWSVLSAMAVYFGQGLLHLVLFVMMGRLSYISLNLLYGYFLGTYLVVCLQPLTPTGPHDSKFGRVVFAILPTVVLYFYWILFWLPHLIGWGWITREML